MKYLFFAALAFIVLFWTPTTADAFAWRLHYWRHRPRVKIFDAVHRPVNQCRGGSCRIR